MLYDGGKVTVLFHYFHITRRTLAEGRKRLDRKENSHQLRQKQYPSLSSIVHTNEQATAPFETLAIETGDKHPHNFYEEFNEFLEKIRRKGSQIPCNSCYRY
jgi:hypothetical protein